MVSLRRAYAITGAPRSPRSTYAFAPMYSGCQRAWKSTISDRPARIGGVHHRLRLGDRRRERLLDQHVLARGQHREHGRGMQMVGRGHGDGIDVAGRDIVEARRPGAAALRRRGPARAAASDRRSRRPCSRDDPSTPPHGCRPTSPAPTIPTRTAIRSPPSRETRRLRVRHAVYPRAHVVDGNGPAPPPP